MGLSNRSQRTAVLGSNMSNQDKQDVPPSLCGTSAMMVPNEISPVYRDFSGASTESIMLTVEPPKPKRKGPRGGVTTPFPVRLFEMLETSHKEGFEHIVSWQPHGRSFAVRKPAIFEQKILPNFFAQTKMSSFQRQLNLYGFLRQNTGRDRGSYYHELFLQNRPDLPKIMLRTRVKGVGMGRTNKVEKEPDFYEMTSCLRPSLPKDKDTRRTISNSSSSSSSLVSNDDESKAMMSPSQQMEEGNAILQQPNAAPRSKDLHRMMAQQGRQQQQQQQEYHQQCGVYPTQSVWIDNNNNVNPARVSPSYHAVVSPEDTGRSVFVPSAYQNNSHNNMMMDDYNVFDDNCHNICQPPLWNGSSSPTSNTLSVIPPVRPSSMSMPTIPYLQPRFTPNNSNKLSSEHRVHHDFPESTFDEYHSMDGETDDTALFEGLEFQIVDDDSLEQFESDLMPDPTTSVSSASSH